MLPTVIGCPLSLKSNVKDVSVLPLYFNSKLLWKGSCLCITNCELPSGKSYWKSSVLYPITTAGGLAILVISCAGKIVSTVCWPGSPIFIFQISCPLVPWAPWTPWSPISPWKPWYPVTPWKPVIPSVPCEPWGPPPLATNWSKL